MKNLFLRIFLFFILFASHLLQSQAWAKLGADKLPIDPHNFMQNMWGAVERNIGMGHIPAIWIDPDNSKHLLIGTYGGGIYETYDALSENITAIHWENLTKNIPAHLIKKIIKNNGVFYAASGYYMNASNMYVSNAKGNYNIYGLGVIKSSDNGNTWQISNMPDPEKGFNCTDFTPPSATGVMYAAARHKVYKSTDYGNTWTDLNITFTQDGFTQDGVENKIITKVVMHPTNPNIVFVSTFAGTVNGNPIQEKVFHSENGGVTWNGLGTIFNYNLISGYNTIGENTSVYTYNNDLYVSFNRSYYTTVIKSSDWINFTVQGNYYTPLSYSSVDYIKNSTNDFLYGATSLIKLGTNNNNGVNLTMNKTHDDIRSVAFTTYNSTEYIFAGHDGGISRSKDGGNTWQYIMGDLNIPLVNNMGYYTDPTERVFDIGTQDTGWYRNHLTDPPSESFVTKAHEGDVYTSPHNKRIYFPGPNGPSITYTDNESDSFSTLQFLDINLWGMVEDPLDSKIRYHPGFKNRIYVYDNNLSSPNLFPDFASVPTGVNDEIVDEDNHGYPAKIALNSNKNILLPIIYYGVIKGIDNQNHYYYKKNGLIFSQDRGLHWEDIGKNIKNADPGLANVMNYQWNVITCVTMDDYNPNRMWVVFAGSGLINQKVYESNDFGKTWKNISYNLSNVASLGLPVNTPGNYPVNQIEYDENRDILFLGTDYGVFYLDRTVNRWKVYGTDLPRCIVTNIFIDDYFNEIVIGTAGSGVWSAPLTDCKDVLIMEDTTWSGQNEIICGDLRIKKDIVLKVYKSNITAKNIVLEPGAKMIWEGGNLFSSNPLVASTGPVMSDPVSNPTTEPGNLNNKSFVIGSRGSKFSLYDVTINNFIVNNFENATLETNMVTAKNTSFNIYENSFYDNYVSNSLAQNNIVTLKNSFLNFYSSYYYKTHNITPNFINSAYYSGIGDIKMNGDGKIRVYDQNINVQNDNLLNSASNTGNYWFEANNAITVGKNVNNALVSGNVSAASKVDMVSKKSITFAKGTLLSNYTFARIDNTISDDLSTPYSRYAATDDDIVYDYDINTTPVNRYGGNSEESEEHENEIFVQNYSDIKTGEDIKIYPNPVIDHFNYKLSDSSLIGSEFTITDLNGKELFRGKFTGDTGEIQLTKYYPDIFLFTFRNKNKIKSIKILKQRLSDETYEKIFD